MKCYSIGSMEYAENLGADWRENLTVFLNKYGIKHLNPCLFEEQQLKGLRPNKLPKSVVNRFTGEELVPTHWHQLKLAQEPHFQERFLRYMRRIINYDIKLLTTEANFAVCYWNSHASRGAGSQSELTYAYLHNIPIYCVEEVAMPAWALGCCTKVFKNFEELYEFLDEEFGDN